MDKAIPITYQDFDRLMLEMGPFEANPEIAIALSGGIDSMALTYLLAEWVRHKSGKIVAITIDHGLRSNSREEANFIGTKLLPKHIEHVIIPWQKIKNPKSNVQAKARKARYELLTDWCLNNNILHLFVAHNKEDQVETLLHNMERGSGIEGLSAMYSISNYKGIRIIRPLLNTLKSQLKNFLNVEGYSWVEDPSNLDDKYKRNKLRKILSLYTDNQYLLMNRIALAAENIKRARCSIENNINNEAVQSIRIYKEGYGKILIKQFITTNEEEGLRLLAALIATISGNEKKARFKSIKKLYNIIKIDKLLKTVTLSNCKISLIRDKNEILVYREVVDRQIDTNLRDNSSIVWDQRFLVTTKKVSDSNSPVKVSYLGQYKLLGEKIEINWLKYNHLPKQILNTLPVIRILDKVVAIPHINYYKYEWLRDNIKIDFSPVKQLTWSI